MNMSSSLKKNTAYNMIYQVVAIISPLITSPYLSRVLGAEGIGIYAYTNSIASYFFLFAMLGVNSYGNRSVAQAKGNRKELSDIFWQIYYLQVICTFIAGIAYLAFCLLLADPNYRVVLLCQAIYVFSAATDINWFAFGMERFKETTIRSLIIKLLTIISIFLFVKSPDDVVPYTMIITCGTVIGVLVMWPLILKETDIQKPDVSKIIKHVKPNLMLFVPYLVSSIYSLDKVMIGYFDGNEAVGYYNYAMNILNIPLSFSTAVCTVFMPRMSCLVREDKEQSVRFLLDKSVQYINILNIALCFGIIGVADVFIPFYLGSNYTATASLLKILSVCLVVSGFSTIIRMEYLIPKNKDKAYTISVIVGSIVNGAGNGILIPIWGAVGACIATIISHFVTLGIQAWATRYELPYGKWIKMMMPFLGCGILEYIIVYYIGLLSIESLVVKIIIQIICGGCLYIACATILLMAVYKDEFVNNTLKNFKTWKMVK